MKKALIAAAALLVGAIGCSRDARPTSVAAPKPAVTLQMPGGFTLRVSETKSHSDQTVHGILLGLRNSELFVDGKSYGQVHNGDTVNLQVKGRVLVNGVKAEPAAH